jgi:protein required for attachment to host cells
MRMVRLRIRAQHAPHSLKVEGAAMRVRILVADQGEADFYDAANAHEMPTFAGGIGDPAARLHDREIASDRPGRVFDHAPAPSGRRGATAHHGTDGERSPRKYESGQFARRVAKLLDEAHRAGEFDRLIVIAPPTFLGRLREALPESLRAIIAAEVRKNLVHQPPSELRAHLPPQAFARPVSPA